MEMITKGLPASGHASSINRAGFFGKRLSEYFGVEGTKLLEVNRHGRLALVVTRLTCSGAKKIGGSPIAPEPALSILHELVDVEGESCVTDGRPIFFRAPKAVSVRITDLHENARCEIVGPVDMLQYYVPCHALADLADEHGISPAQSLSWERDRHDPFLSILSALLLRALSENGASCREFVERIALSVLAHIVQTYGSARARSSVAKGGLAPWQERRAKEMMRAGLASDLSVGDIAAQCRLTSSHFARCFKRSTGLAPHQFLTRVRVEEAKRLMLTTKLSLADIALACGFGEQSYFTRVFSRSVGASPGAWRRSRSEG